MNTDRYPVEMLPDNNDLSYWSSCDDGTMPKNVDKLRQTVVGRRIIKAERRPFERCTHWDVMEDAFFLTLDDGTEVRMIDTADCCAYTELKEFMLHPELVDHVIMGVGTTRNYQRWHIYADLGDILELTVGWSCGNPFYYGYGFDIDVVPA